MTVSEQVVRPESSKDIASRVVNECLMVKPNEQVIINTWDHTLDLAGKLALEVEKASGVSTVTMMSNDFYWSYLSGVPEEQFKRTPKAFLSMLDQADAIIAIGGPKDPSGYTRVPTEKSAKWIDGQQVIADKTAERKIRTIGLQYGLVTRERAKQYGFDYENWMRITNNSIDVDYSKISITGQKLADKIQKGKEARLTSQNGTDLRFKLKGRPAHVRDGILDHNDIDRGLLFESLPAGMIEHAPDEESAEGVVQFDQPNAMAGKMITGLRWEFKNGRLSHYSATANLDSFKGLYEGATGDKDQIGGLAIGLNPRAEPIGFFSDRMVQGTVSISIGGNNGIGGSNNTIFGQEGHLRRATLEIDGARLIADGKILD